MILRPLSSYGSRGKLGEQDKNVRVALVLVVRDRIRITVRNRVRIMVKIRVSIRFNAWIIELIALINPPFWIFFKRTVCFCTKCPGSN